jgi:hypothetical protein
MPAGIWGYDMLIERQAINQRVPQTGMKACGVEQQKAGSGCLRLAPFEPANVSVGRAKAMLDRLAGPFSHGRDQPCTTPGAKRILSSLSCLSSG